MTACGLTARQNLRSSGTGGSNPACSSGESGIARAPCHLGLNTAKRRRREIQPIDKRIDKAHRVVRTDIVIHCPPAKAAPASGRDQRCTETTWRGIGEVIGVFLWSEAVEKGANAATGGL